MRMMGKLGAAAMACLLSVAMAGCIQLTPADTPDKSAQEEPLPSTSQPQSSAEAATPEPVELSESGWFCDESGYVFYGIGLKNPNRTFQADFPTVKITGKDADGKIVFSDEMVYGTMLPGCEYYAAGQCGNGTKPHTVEFTVSISDQNWIENQNEFPTAYEIHNINAVDGKYGGCDFTGEITSVQRPLGDGSPEQSVWLYAILRDANGKIVGGFSSYEDSPQEGETEPFGISAYASKLPGYKSYEIHAWGDYGGTSVVPESSDRETAQKDVDSPNEERASEKSDANDPAATESDADPKKVAGIKLKRFSDMGISYLAPSNWDKSGGEDAVTYEGDGMLIGYSVFDGAGALYDEPASDDPSTDENLLECIVNTMGVFKASGNVEGEAHVSMFGDLPAQSAVYNLNGNPGYIVVLGGFDGYKTAVVTIVPKNTDDEAVEKCVEVINAICPSIKKA